MIENKNKRILMISIPIIIQGLAEHFQSMIDRAFLGNYNSDYLSALGNAVTPYFMTIQILFALAIGTTVIVARNIGAGELVKARRYSEVSIFFNSIISIFFFAIWFIFPESIFKLTQVQEPILGYSVSYVRIVSFSLLFYGMQLSSEAVLQAAGITRIIMYAGFLRNALNILLDWILIYGKFGFPEMGIEGAALATMISNIISSVFVIFMILKNKKMPFLVSIKGIFKPKFKLYWSVMKIGIPSGIEGFLWSFGSLILIVFLNLISKDAVGIYTLTFSIQLVAFYTFQGFAKTSTTLIAQKTGEKKNDEAYKYGLLCLAFSIISCVIFSILFITIPKEIIGLFTNNVDIINKSVLYLMISAGIIYFGAVNVVIGYSIKGYGDTKWMLYTQIFGTAYIIAMSYLLMFVFGYGILGLFIAILSDELIRGIVNFLRYRKFKTKPIDINNDTFELENVS